MSDDKKSKKKSPPAPAEANEGDAKRKYEPGDGPYERVHADVIGSMEAQYCCNPFDQADACDFTGGPDELTLPSFKALNSSISRVHGLKRGFFPGDEAIYARCPQHAHEVRYGNRTIRETFKYTADRWAGKGRTPSTWMAQPLPHPEAFNKHPYCTPCSGSCGGLWLETNLYAPQPEALVEQLEDVESTGALTREHFGAHLLCKRCVDADAVEQGTLVEFATIVAALGWEPREYVPEALDLEGFEGTQVTVEHPQLEVSQKLQAVVRSTHTSFGVFARIVDDGRDALLRWEDVNADYNVGDVIDIWIARLHCKTGEDGESDRLFIWAADTKPVLLADVKSGQEFDGEVASHAPFGMFVRIGPALPAGVVHKSVLSGRSRDDFPVNTFVRVMVSDVDHKRSRLNLVLVEDVEGSRAVQDWKAQAPGAEDVVSVDQEVGKGKTPTKVGLTMVPPKSEQPKSKKSRFVPRRRTTYVVGPKPAAAQQREEVEAQLADAAKVFGEAEHIQKTGTYGAGSKDSIGRSLEGRKAGKAKRSKAEEIKDRTLKVFGDLFNVRQGKGKKGKGN